MARISTHVLDIAKGRPAAGVTIELFFGLVPRGRAQTNSDGRTDQPLVDTATLEPGGYDLVFHVGNYLRSNDEEAFFERITVSFVVNDGAANYHVPLLLAPHGYSTYRGS